MRAAFHEVRQTPSNAIAVILGIFLLLTLGIGGPLVAIHQTRLKDETVEARNLAAMRAKTLRRQMYSFEMITAAKEASDPAGIPKIDRWIPQPGDGLTDLRGWEWHYARAVTNKPIARFDTQRAKPTIVCSANSNALLLLDGNHNLSEWEFETGRITRRWSIPPEVKSFAVIPGSDQIKMTADTKRIRKSLLTTEEELVFEMPRPEFNGSWRPDGRHLAVIHPRNPPVKMQSTLTLWLAGSEFSLATSTDIRGASTSPVAWSADGKRLAIANEPFGDLSLFDATTGQRIATEKVVERITNMQAVAWSPAGYLIALLAEDGEILVVQAEDLKPEEGWNKVVRHSAAKALAWSPNSTWIVSGGDDRIARVWEISTRKEVLAFRGHTDSIDMLA